MTGKTSELLSHRNHTKELAKRHELEFTTTEITFSTRDDAIIWIIKNQFGRRNLSAYDRSILALKLKPVIAAKAKERMLAGKANPTQNSAQGETRQEIAKAAGVSHDTIAKVERIEQQATPEIKAALKSGDMSINQAYKEIKRAEKETRQEAHRAENTAKVEKLATPLDAKGLFQTQLSNPSYYSEMTQDELKAIELPAAENCVLS